MPIIRDASRSEKVELRRSRSTSGPTRPRAERQDGAVFVWTCRGRAEVVGHDLLVPRQGRADGRPRVPLARDDGARRRPARDALAQGSPWSPGVAGITPRAIPDAPAPGTLARRSDSRRCAT